MTNEKYKYDINKLKNYKILDSHFESPTVKMFVDCVIEADSENDVIRCNDYYHYDEIDRYGDYFSVQSAGDSRCSGKSEILYLMFPSILKHTPFGQEETGISTHDEEPLKNTVCSIHKNYHPPSEDTLAIYVKRDFNEKYKCLLARGKREDGSSVILPNEIEDTPEMVIRYRETNLPQLVEQKNYILMENMNIEEHGIADKKTTCDTANRRINNAIDNMKRRLSLDEKIVGMGIYKDSHKKFFEDDLSRMNKEIETTKEYEEMCDLSNRYKELESIVDKRRTLSKQHT